MVPGPAKLKIVRVRSVLDDVSVPFASCPPNRRHSEYSKFLNGCQLQCALLLTCRHVISRA